MPGNKRILCVKKVDKERHFPGFRSLFRLCIHEWYRATVTRRFEFTIILVFFQGLPRGASFQLLCVLFIFFNNIAVLSSRMLPSISSIDGICQWNIGINNMCFCSDYSWGLKTQICLPLSSVTHRSPSSAHALCITRQPTRTRYDLHLPIREMYDLNFGQPEQYIPYLSQSEQYRTYLTQSEKCITYCTSANHRNA